ncbi:MAG: biotin/lipoate A/B protein ligase family protein [Candidatus Thorarchaeota archaeon]
MQARLIQYSFPNQAENLAAEESVAVGVQKRESPPSVLIWKNRNAAVLGKFQCWRNEISLDACYRYNTEILRRFSGGGAVFQDLGNVNVSFILPLEEGQPLSTGFEIQKQISKAFRGAIATFGVSPTSLPRGGVAVNEKKISGFAGVIKMGLVVSHYTLLISSDLSKIAEILTPAKRKIKGCVESYPWPVANLNRLIVVPFTEHKFIGALGEQLQRYLGVNLEKADLFPVEIQRRSELTKHKHSKKGWVFRR